jgi:hypothetical protein
MSREFLTTTNIGSKEADLEMRKKLLHIWTSKYQPNIEESLNPHFLKSKNHPSINMSFSPISIPFEIPVYDFADSRNFKIKKRDNIQEVVDEIFKHEKHSN